MEVYYDASLTASILLQEVMKDLKIKFKPEQCCKNGLDKKIFRRCKSIIEKEYSDSDYQELLKLYISSYFVEETLDETDVVFEDYDDNYLESSVPEFSDEDIYLTN